MTANLFDAHNHLHDDALAPHLPRILQDCHALGIRRMVVNGTCEADWERVSELTKHHEWVLPSYGVHPWKVGERSGGWQKNLERRLDAGGFVGEIGLDRWKPGGNFEDQTVIFRRQLALATERNLPVTLHCLRAWGAMLEALRTERPPERGFLLHAYGGPAEMVPEFVALGAYFSFSGSFLAPGRERKLAPFRIIPLDRLLVETDAPAMPPPEAFDRHPLPPGKNGVRLHHPANLTVAYQSLAALRRMPDGGLASRITENFDRFFGPL